MFYPKQMSGPSNVLGEKLELCCSDPMTGFYRNGMLLQAPMIMTHTVVRVTAVFLNFPDREEMTFQHRPHFDFPGLVEATNGACTSPAGKRHWITEWRRVYLKATHQCPWYVDLEIYNLMPQKMSLEHCLTVTS